MPKIKEMQVKFCESLFYIHGNSKKLNSLIPGHVLSRRFEFNKSRDLCFAWSCSFALDQPYTFIQKINPND